MNELIERMVAAVPPELMAGTVQRVRIEAAQLEETLQSRLPKIFRAPVSTIATVAHGIGSVADALTELTEFSWPQEQREELARLVERKGPGLLKELVQFAREKLAQLEAEPKTLEFLPYFARVERAHPYATVFALACLLKFAEDSPAATYNLIAQLKGPEFDDSAGDEERSRPSLEWASRVVKTAYFPFAVRGVAIVESIRSGRKLHMLDDAKAVGDVNKSLKEVSDAPQLRSDLAILRNGEAHPVTGFEVRGDGSAVLTDKNKPPIELSAADCVQIGRDALAETIRIGAALTIPALWRMAEDLAASNIVAVVAAEFRGEEPPELASSMESLGTLTEERLVKLELLPRDVISS